jgi:hypothetical protein
MGDSPAPPSRAYAIAVTRLEAHLNKVAAIQDWAMAASDAAPVLGRRLRNAQLQSGNGTGVVQDWWLDQLPSDDVSNTSRSRKLLYALSDYTGVRV